MKITKSTFISIISSLFFVVGFAELSGQPQVQYGAYMPLKDGEQNGVQIAFKLYPDGTQYYKIKNTYSVTVNVKCKFTYTDRGGQRHTETACGSDKLAPGQEYTNGGCFDFGVASVDNSSLTAVVTLGGGTGNTNKNGVSTPAVPSSSGAGASEPANVGTNGQNQTLVFPGRPSEVGVEKGPEWKMYASGQHLNLPNGSHDLPAWSYQYIKQDELRCPERVVSGKLMAYYAVYENFARFQVVIENGVITSSHGNPGYQNFLSCVTAEEARNYPKSNHVTVH